MYVEPGPEYTAAVNANITAAIAASWEAPTTAINTGYVLFTTYLYFLMQTGFLLVCRSHP